MKKLTLLLMLGMLAGVVSAQTKVTPQLGGTGIDTSHATGCLQVIDGNWSTVGTGCSGGGGGSPLTTKGDLFGYSTTNARVPVGANGQLLTSDSTAATGVSWQNPPNTNWSSLIGGTNTGRAFLIGSGASLGTTSGGTITATAAPFSGLTGNLGTSQGPTSITGLLKDAAGTLSAATAGTDYLTPTGSSAGLSQATTGAFGVVKPDGATITISGGVLSAAGGLPCTGTCTAGNLTKFGTGGTSTTNSLATDDGTTFTYPGTGGIAVSGPGKLSLGAVTTTLSALTANTAGFAGPATGGTAYLFKMPATASAGILYAAAPATNDGVNESALSFVPFSWDCQAGGLGDGVNVIPANTYPQTNCKNNTGKTVTITGIQCFADTGSSTMNVSGHTAGALLTGPITCSSSYAAGTQSSTITLANGDWAEFSFVSDGTTKQTSWAIYGTHP